MAHGDAQRMLNVIRQLIQQETKGGAKIEYAYGEIADASSGYMVSAYLNGNYEDTSDEFRVPGHFHVNAGDYGMFAIDHARGSKWLVEVLPNSLYAKIAIDINEGVIYTGEGDAPPSVPFAGSGGGGEDLIWEGTEFVYDDDGSGDEFLWE